MRSRLILITALLSLTFLVACGDAKEEETEGDETFEITEEEKVADDEVVAHLNGEEVKGDRYNLAYLQTKLQLFQLGEDTKDLEFVKEFALDTLIDQELVYQDALEKGIEVSEEEVESELSEIKSDPEMKEGLESYIDMYGFTEDKYKEMLSFSMLYDKYVEAEFPDLEVSDEEIEEAYEQLKSTIEDLDPLEDIEESLRMSLIHEKQAQKMQERMDELKEKAEIEINI